MSRKLAATGAALCLCLAVYPWSGPSAAGAATAGNGEIPFDAPLVGDLADGGLDSFTLTEAALIASGVANDEELALYRGRIERIVASATARVGRRGDPARRGRKLLSELHRVALRKYESTSDRLPDLVDQGIYNCVSASLLYIIAARSVGLDVAAAETPLHVFVVLDTGERRIDIEATSPTGFDARRGLADFRAFVLANKYATPEELAQRGAETIFNEFNSLTHPVAPEHAVAFLYHNAGIRALQARDAGAAARHLINAARIYPRLGYRSDDLRTTLAWSAREQYDAGEYVGAFHVAEVALRLFPDRTTVRDRFTAVAARVVEEAAGRGDIESAERFAARTLDQIHDGLSRRRFESFTAPVLARAALHARDWPAARRHAGRFLTVSPDTMEAERFAAWVEARVAEGQEVGGATVDFVAETRAALAAVAAEEGAAATDDYAAVVRGIAALASQGRYEEALAVGRAQRASLAAEVGREGLDTLLKAVAARQVNELVEARRWREAGAAIDAALAQWPGHGDLIALHHRARAAMAQDPYRLSSWPEAVRSQGAAAAKSAAAAPRAGARR